MICTEIPNFIDDFIILKTDIFLKFVRLIVPETDICHIWERY